MKNVLVVANETVGGRQLREAVRQRFEQGNARFIVIAPQNRPKHGNVIWDEAVRDAAQQRVDMTISQLRDIGIPAIGEVMDPDPFTAIMDAVDQYDIEEIIISTHPDTRSGWMRRGLIERVEDATGLPVTHVVVDLSSDEEIVNTLVVANQTAGGEALFRRLIEKAGESHDHWFTVIVPQARDKGAQEARGRLIGLMDRLRDAGLRVSGGIGDPDPFVAIMNTLQVTRVNDIVISSFPATKSGWMRADLIERVRRACSVPVEHVVVDLEAEQAAKQATAA